MSYLKLDDAEIYFELHGEGPPVVFIHGASGTHLTWWQQVAELRHSYSCLIFDQRGFGNSRPTRAYDIGDGNILYRDLLALIDHVGFNGDKLCIVGASMGTGPALHFAMENPHRMAKLVLACGPGGATTPLIAEGWEQRSDRMRMRQQQLREDPVVRGTSRRLPPVRSPGERERFGVAYHPYGPVGEAMFLDAPALTFLYAEIMVLAAGPPTAQLGTCFQARTVTRDDASRIEFPVLVVGGTEDPLFPPRELEEVAEMFPKGQIHLFKGAGHAAYYERARRFNDLLLDFLDPAAAA